MNEQNNDLNDLNRYSCVGVSENTGPAARSVKFHQALHFLLIEATPGFPIVQTFWHPFWAAAPIGEEVL